jgi:hypothetical protein
MRESVGFQKSILLIIIWISVALLLSAGRLSGGEYGLQGDLPLHYHLTREMIRAMSEWEIYPGWAGLLDGGRGDSFFKFYPPLFYWLSSTASLVAGISIPGSLKLMTVLILIFNQATSWVLARNFYGWWESVAASLLYVALPGLALIGLNRGFLPQALAMGFLPLAIAGAERILRDERGRRAELIFLIGICGVVLTHAITAYLSALAIGLLVLTSSPWHDWRAIIRLARAAILGGGMSAFFWLPQILELRLVQIGKQVVRQEYGDYLLFAPAAGDSVYRQSWHGLNDVASGVIIAQTLLTLIASIFVARITGRAGGSTRGRRFFPRFGIATSLFGLLISLPMMKSVWRMVPGLQFIQFPWRWQPITSVIGAVLVVAMWRYRDNGGNGGTERPTTEGWSGMGRMVTGTFCVGLLVVNIFLTFQLCRPYSRGDGAAELKLLTETGPASSLSYEEAMAMQDRGDPGYLRYTANQVYFRPLTAETRIFSAVDRPGSLEVISGETQIEELLLRIRHRRFRVRSEIGGRVRLVTYAHPHWQARLDGEPVAIETEPGSGMILTTVPPGEHELWFDYHPPLYPAWISGFALMVGMLSFRSRRL